MLRTEETEMKNRQGQQVVVYMKERINRMAKGIIETELPQMSWSPEVIEETVRINTVFRRELLIESRNRLNVKGFIYSSDVRVRIPGDNNTFGGLRSHIVYEVDTSYLAAGDEIEGSFYLVTSCGEKEIPYHFRVDLSGTGEMLGNLKTPEDFLKTAERDMDTALRLLEYPDLTEAPFMQDPHVRAIYDGLKGHGSRQNVMEEFLVALGVKKAVSLTADTRRKEYVNPDARLEDTIRLSCDSWGYQHVEFSADGDFLHLPKKSAAQADFSDGVFALPFSILPERLHGGRNFGRILIRTAQEKIEVLVEVLMQEQEHSEKRALFIQACKRYVLHRLSFETGQGKNGDLLAGLQKELDQMLLTGNNLFLQLLQAELYLLASREDKAAQLLSALQPEIAAKRLENRAAYCFYQYLLAQKSGEEKHLEELLQLLDGYAFGSTLKGRERDFYYLLLIRLDEKLKKSPETLLLSLEERFQDGCISPFLYVECVRILEERPDLLKRISPFMVQVLHFAVKHGMLSRALSQAAAKALNTSRGYKPLYLRLFASIYQSCPEPELLFAICSMLIKGNLRGERYFHWYEKAVQAGVNLTRLYEYFLYSLPENYGKLLPREILLYFSYTAELAVDSRRVLYQNILLYAEPASDIYRTYERAMEQFALEQLFAGHIDEKLAVIYQHMIYSDLIDAQLARVLPGVLKSYWISCFDPSICYVAVRHEELTKEELYPVRDGQAFVPLYSERDVIFFQDAFGRRYLNLPYKKQPMMANTEELMNCCFASCPEHPVLFALSCRAAMEQKEMKAEEAAALEQADLRLPLHPLFRAKLRSAMLRYYRKMADSQEEGKTNETINYLLCIDKDPLTREERNGICETLIRSHYDKEAYGMLCRYGSEGISGKWLFKLCSRMIEKKLYDSDKHLLSLAYQVVQEETPDRVLLNYLCEHFNGTTEQMYRLLVQAVREHTETYDLEERLAAQMLFTGQTEKLDRVFEWYVSRKKTEENVVRAFFTLKSAQYFLSGQETGDKIFEYLETAVYHSAEKDKVPELYLLALTKYYSTLPELKIEQKALCQSVIDVLLEAGMVFSYFKDLAGFVEIPEDILDKEIIEYHGSREKKPYLWLRILPEEEEYHYEELRPVYKGIYILEKVLFEGEILEYQIKEDAEDGQQLVAEGSISCREIAKRASGSRFVCLNEMSLSQDLKNETALKEKMEEYIRRDAAASVLFPLI